MNVTEASWSGFFFWGIFLGLICGFIHGLTIWIADEAINTFQDVETAFSAEKEAASIFPKFEELSSAV